MRCKSYPELEAGIKIQVRSNSGPVKFRPGQIQARSNSGPVKFRPSQIQARSNSGPVNAFKTSTNKQKMNLIRTLFVLHLSKHRPSLARFQRWSYQTSLSNYKLAAVRFKFVTMQYALHWSKIYIA